VDTVPEDFKRRAPQQDLAHNVPNAGNGNAALSRDLTRVPAMVAGSFESLRTVPVS
jgi:hypothetical protein